MKVKIFLSLIFILHSLNSVFAQQLNLFPDLMVKGDPYINAIAQTASGDYLIASRIDHINGIPCGNLARIDDSGNLVNGFTKVITDGHILKIAPQADGKIFVCGLFKHINGVAASFARLNSDGTVDNSFPNFNSSTVNSFEIQVDGKIILAAGNGLIRLNSDGSVDNSFTDFNGPLGFVTNILFDDNQNIFASDGHNLFKLDKDGNPLSGFPIAVNSDDGYFFSIRKYGDQLLIGGKFSSIAGENRNNIALINGDGTIASLSWPEAPYISDMAVTSNGDILINDLNEIIAYNSSLVEIDSIAHGAPERIFIDNSGRIVISGRSWLSSMDAPHPYMLRLAANYSVDDTFLCNATYTGGIKAIVSQSDGKIVIGGDYSFAGINSSTNKLMRLKLNGEIDNTFNPALGESYYINALDIQSDGKILVCTDKLIRLNKSGSVDNTFSYDEGSYALEKVKYANNSIYLCGYFDAIKGYASNGIIKLKMDGAPDDSFKSELPANSYVTSFAFQSDNKIIVTGAFFINGELFSVMRLNPDGTVDNSFSPGQCIANGIWKVAVDAFDRIYISGSFYQFNGTSYSQFVRLMPGGDLDSSYDPAIPFDVNDTVYGLEILSDNEVVVGAETYYDQPSLIVKDENGNTIDKEFTHLGALSSTSASYFDGATLYLGGRIVSQDQSSVSGISYINIYPVDGDVSNFQAFRNGPSKANLSWTNNYVKASLLIIERSTSNDQNFAPIDTISASAISYVDSLVTNSTSYFYRIKAINTSSSTGYSSEVSIDPAIPQSIAFNPIDTKVVTDEHFSLNAQASSELPITFSSTSDKIAISGNQVIILNAGRVSITASQKGAGNYDAAPSVEQSFCINPAKPLITVGDFNGSSTILTSSATVGNQWFFNQAPISDATAVTYAADQPGAYSLQVTEDDCLSEFADNINLIITGDIKNSSSTNSITVFPNPASDQVVISSEKELIKEISVLQMDGKKLESFSSENMEVNLNMRGHTGGLYIIKVTTANGVIMKKLIKN